MAFILLYLIIFPFSESLFIDDSGAISNRFTQEISNATFHNGSHRFGALRFLSSVSTKHLNGSVNPSNFTTAKATNSTKLNGSESEMKRVVEDIDDFQVDMASENVTAIEAKMDGMPDQVASELSKGARIDDSDDPFMTRFMFDGFPEFSWHRSKRNDSSTEPRKKFTFFRRFILI